MPTAAAAALASSSLPASPGERGFIPMSHALPYRHRACNTAGTGLQSRQHYFSVDKKADDHDILSTEKGPENILPTMYDVTSFWIDVFSFCKHTCFSMLDLFGSICLVCWT